MAISDYGELRSERREAIKCLTTFCSTLHRKLLLFTLSSLKLKIVQVGSDDNSAIDRDDATCK